MVEQRPDLEKDKKTIVCVCVCEDGRRNIYKERHLKLEPDVCECFCECVCACLCASMKFWLETTVHAILFPVMFLRVHGFDNIFWIQLNDRVQE